MKTALELMEDHAKALTEQRDALAADLAHEQATHDHIVSLLDAKVTQLEAALKEAVEWDWMTDPESISEEAQKLVMDALHPTSQERRDEHG